MSARSQTQPTSVFFSGLVKGAMCDADLTAPPAKRARIEVLPFLELDLSKISLRSSGVGPGGGLRVYPSLDGEAIRFNLTPYKWLETPNGFDLSTTYEEKVPSFLGGKPPANGAPEGLLRRFEQ